MFKGIYYVYSEDLQFSAVKIIPKMSENRANKSYLILNRQFFCRAIGICSVKPHTARKLGCSLSAETLAQFTLYQLSECSVKLV